MAIEKIYCPLVGFKELIKLLSKNPNGSEEKITNHHKRVYFHHSTSIDLIMRKKP